MKGFTCSNVTVSRLERYLMDLLPAQMAGRIYDESITSLEEHLLICPECLAFAETHESMVNVLRRVQAKVAGLAMSAGDTPGA